MGFIPSRLYFRHKQLSILTKVLMVNFEVFFWADAGWKGDFKVRIYWCITSVPIFQLFCHKRSYKGLMLEMYTFLFSTWWPIYVFNWVVNTKLLTLPPTQHHSFFRNLPPLFCHRVYSATEFTGNFVKK